MARPLLLLLTSIVFLFAIACEEESGSNGDPTAQLTPLTTNGAPTTDETPTDEQPDLYETPEPTEVGEDSAGSSDLFGTFNPFSALQGLSGGAPSQTDVDPALKATLLTAQDLPAGFLSFGEFGFSVPDPDVGNIDTAAAMFMSGDVESGELGAMVMSMAAALPAGQDMSDLDELDDLSQAELDEIAASAGQFGVAFGDIRVLDASGLGESGGAIHMELDFAGLFAGLGAPQGPPGENPFAEGIAMDMYMFARGETMLMLMLMYPAGGDAPVDGHALAEIMDGRAS
jgi:hypothetical protein